MSPEAASPPAAAGSVPNFDRPVSARGPGEPPRDETYLEWKERTERELRETEALRAEIERRWQQMGGGIMRPEPGSGRPRPVTPPGQTPTADLPLQLPRTETPEQRQARLDRECREMRELMDRLNRPINIAAPERPRRPRRR